MMLWRRLGLMMMMYFGSVGLAACGDNPTAPQKRETSVNKVHARLDFWQCSWNGDPWTPMEDRENYECHTVESTPGYCDPWNGCTFDCTQLGNPCDPGPTGPGGGGGGNTPTCPQFATCPNPGGGTNPNPSGPTGPPPDTTPTLPPPEQVEACQDLASLNFSETADATFNSNASFDDPPGIAEMAALLALYATCHQAAPSGTELWLKYRDFVRNQADLKVCSASGSDRAWCKELFDKYIYGDNENVQLTSQRFAAIAAEAANCAQLWERSFTRNGQTYNVYDVHFYDTPKFAGSLGGAKIAKDANGNIVGMWDDYSMGWKIGANSRGITAQIQTVAASVLSAPMMPKMYWIYYGITSEAEVPSTTP